jgi:hypothetical protein
MSERIKTLTPVKICKLANVIDFNHFQCSVHPHIMQFKMLRNNRLNSHTFTHKGTELKKEKNKSFQRDNRENKIWKPKVHKHLKCCQTLK